MARLQQRGVIQEVCSTSRRVPAKKTFRHSFMGKHALTSQKEKFGQSLQNQEQEGEKILTCKMFSKRLHLSSLQSSPPSFS